MHRLTRAGLLLSLALGAPVAAGAATRSYIVTDYDSLRLEGPFDVTVEIGRSVTARGEGDTDLLERVDLSVAARMLTVKLKPSPFEARRGEGGGPVKLRLTVPALRRVQLSGAGSLHANGLARARSEVIQAGSGSIAISGIDADLLGVVQLGSGAIQLAGKTRSATMHLSGTGALDAKALGITDLDLTVEGASTVAASADRSARIVAVGSGNIIVEGKAACTVNHAGGGTTRCGGRDY